MSFIALGTLVKASCSRILEKIMIAIAYPIAVATAIGYAIAIIIFSSIREQLALTKVPKAMKDIPIALITAGIIAMAFMGFSGIDQVF